MQQSHEKGSSALRLWAYSCDDACWRFCSDKKLGDGLSSEGAGALFAGSNQTTTLDCAGGGAHIFGSNNTLTLTGGCAGLDMVGSNNTIIVALANGANIEFAGSNNAITWTSPEEARHMAANLAKLPGHLRKG